MKKTKTKHNLSKGKKNVCIQRMRKQKQMGQNGDNT